MAHIGGEGQAHWSQVQGGQLSKAEAAALASNPKLADLLKNSGITDVGAHFREINKGNPTVDRKVNGTRWTSQTTANRLRGKYGLGEGGGRAAEQKQPSAFDPKPQGGRGWTSWNRGPQQAETSPAAPTAPPPEPEPTPPAATTKGGKTGKAAKAAKAKGKGKAKTPPDAFSGVRGDAFKMIARKKGIHGAEKGETVARKDFAREGVKGWAGIKGDYQANKKTGMSSGDAQKAALESFVANRDQIEPAMKQAAHQILALEMEKAGHTEAEIRDPETAKGFYQQNKNVVDTNVRVALRVMGSKSGKADMIKAQTTDEIFAPSPEVVQSWLFGK